MKFEYMKVTVKLRALESAHLPAYLGSTLRGAIGTSLYERYCIKKPGDCAHCPLGEICTYVSLFRCTRYENDHMRSYPNPYIIYPHETKEEFGAGDTLSFDFTLLGSFAKYFPAYFEAIKDIERNGLGVYRRRFSLCRITDGEGRRLIYYDGRLLHKPEISSFVFKDESAAGVLLNFDTPLKLRTASHGDAHKITPAMLLSALRRRAGEICAVYGTEADTIPEPPADGCKVRRDTLKWMPLERYSNREGGKIDISGLTGELEIIGNITPALNLLELGQIIHVGKACTMGLGHYMMFTY